MLREGRILEITSCASIDASQCLIGELLLKVESISPTTTRFARTGAHKVWYLDSPGAQAFLPFCWAVNEDASVTVLHYHGCGK